MNLGNVTLTSKRGTVFDVYLFMYKNMKFNLVNWSSKPQIMVNELHGLVFVTGAVLKMLGDKYYFDITNACIFTELYPSLINLAQVDFETAPIIYTCFDVKKTAILKSFNEVNDHIMQYEHVQKFSFEIDAVLTLGKLNNLSDCFLWKCQLCDMINKCTSEVCNGYDCHGTREVEALWFSLECNMKDKDDVVIRAMLTGPALSVLLNTKVTENEELYDKISQIENKSINAILVIDFNERFKVKYYIRGIKKWNLL